MRDAACALNNTVISIAHTFHKCGDRCCRGERCARWREHFVYESLRALVSRTPRHTLIVVALPSLPKPPCSMAPAWHTVSHGRKLLVSRVKGRRAEGCVQNVRLQASSTSSRIPIPARRCKLNATQTGAAGYAGSEQRHHRRAAAALGLLVRARARTRARARARATEYY